MIGDPRALAARFRRARLGRVMDVLSAIRAERGSVRVLDLGGEPGYWRLYDRDVLQANQVSVTLVNPTPQTVDDPLFTSVVGDACSLPDIAAGEYDLVHSNSVIEHVGDWGRMEAFAGEVRRLAPRYYVQTPYYYFPVEPHFMAPFFHWRSEQARMAMLMRRRRGWFDRAADVGEAMRIVQHARLLDKRQFRFLFPDAEHLDERLAGLTKSLIALRT